MQVADIGTQNKWSMYGSSQYGYKMQVADIGTQNKWGMCNNKSHRSHYGARNSLL